MNRIYGLHEINNKKCVRRQERAVENNVLFLLLWIHCSFLRLIHNKKFVWKLLANILSLTYNNVVSQKFPTLFTSKYLGPATTENHTVLKKYKNSESLD